MLRQSIPNLRKLDGEVAKQNQPGTLPLLLPCWNLLVLNLVLVEGGDAVDDHPGKRAAKVDDLMHDKGHDARRKHIVLHKGVPCQPEALKGVEGDIVCGNFVVLAPVRVGTSTSAEEGAVPARAVSKGVT